MRVEISADGCVDMADIRLPAPHCSHCETRWQPDARHLLYGLGALLLAIGYAYVVASLTEFRTDKVRGWVEKRVLGKAMRVKGPIPAK